MESIGDYWAKLDPQVNDLEAAREAGDIPDLAAAWLALIAEDGGLPGISKHGLTHKGRPLSRPILEDPVNTPLNANTYPARLDNGQVIWVKLMNGPYDAPESASVVEKPHTVKATLVALTVMEGDTVDIEQLEQLLPLIDLSHPAGVSEGVDEAFQKFADAGDLDRALSFAGSFPSQTVSYALALLRYYRPGFDALPEDEQRGLLISCCDRMNKSAAATDQLAAFLEYGSPTRDQRPAVENPSRDVKAAVLRDVEQKTYREIAEGLRVVVSDNAKLVGDYSTVSKMVVRGREILERACNGWSDMAAQMRVEYDRRSTLSMVETYIEDMAGVWGVSPQAARNILDREEHIPPPKDAWISYNSLEGHRDFYAKLVQEEA